MAFHPDGKIAGLGRPQGDRQASWDPATGATVREFDARVLYRYDRIQDVGGVRCLAFDPAGKLLACAGTPPRTGGIRAGHPDDPALRLGDRPVAAAR